MPQIKRTLSNNSLSTREAIADAMSQLPKMRRELGSSSRPNSTLTVESSETKKDYMNLVETLTPSRSTSSNSLTSFEIYDSFHEDDNLPAQAPVAQQQHAYAQHPQPITQEAASISVPQNALMPYPSINKILEKAAKFEGIVTDATPRAELIDSDILIGKDKAIHKHIGNIEYREFLNQYINYYTAAKKKFAYNNATENKYTENKSTITEGLYVHIHEKGYKFVSKENGKYYEAAKDKSCNKIKQFFRDSRALSRQENFGKNFIF